jgi:glucose/arabinose dehydrogenase
MYDSSGAFLSTFASVGAAHNVIVRNDGRVLVSSHYMDQVYILNPDGSDGSVFAGRGFGNGAAGIALDDLNRLYVSDHSRGVILQYNAEATGYGIWAVGLSSPNQIAFHNGVGFVTDQNSGRVLTFDGDGNQTGVFASGLAGPVGIAFDDADRVYVSDYFGGVVRRYEADGSGAVDILTGLANPHGLAIGADEQLYVVEQGLNRMIRSSKDGTGSSVFISTGLYTPGHFTIREGAIPTAVPEPGAWALLVSGGAMAGLVARRRRITQSKGRGN